MDGMILAAGFGSRLRPITDEMPKALVEVNGIPMLERVARRLIGAGVDRLVINTHHHADQIRDFVEARDGFGVEVRLSHEPGSPLETGGGLLHAREHFRGGAFFLHNVDIICDADLGAMYRAHARGPAVATLAVSGRDSSRVLRFDARGLQARVDLDNGTVEAAREPEGETRDRAFAGIHVIDPTIFDALEEESEEAFSIIPPYLRLAGAGRRIEPFDISGSLWLEIGNPERLERARRILREDTNAGGRGKEEGT